MENKVERIKELRRQVAEKRKQKALLKEEKKLKEELEKDSIKGKLKRGAKQIFDWMG